MQIVPSKKQVLADHLAKILVEWLESLADRHDLSGASFYHRFPLYRDSDGNNILADALLVSPVHGVIAFAIPDNPQALPEVMDRFEQVPAHIHSRLIRTKALRSGPFQLIPSISAAVALSRPEALTLPDGFQLVDSIQSLDAFLQSVTVDALDDTVFKELLATIDGAKGLVKAVTRQPPKDATQEKAKIAYLVETAISEFDMQQKHGMYGAISGLIRLRGIAGSGKTVVLAMKAALAHLREPNALVLYTFYTKSLYQHVRRLITRFYRQFDDKDPDWNHIHVRHAWGGKTTPGVYSETALRHGIEPLSYSAARGHLIDPFDFACGQLEKVAKIEPLYDYVLIDEGQDYPASFTRICHRLAKNGNLVFAYDELQNIFQPTAPDVDKHFTTSGTEQKVTFVEDVILHRCYRNPLEVLVCAHAIGFGFYGKKIVQLLEGQKHWEDVGYRVVQGDFSEGSQIIMERPEETSLGIVSKYASKDDIVKAGSFETLGGEIGAIITSIKEDLNAGLKPEDILVVCVDDRNAQTYLREIQQRLVAAEIRVNNLQEDTYGSKEFWIGGHITLSTVHKAKGNEAFMVYVVGADGPMQTPDVKRRNMLFTAMTRAKAWLRVTGCGDPATALFEEMKAALANCPRLVFTQPSAGEIEIIKRDVAESLDRKAKVRRIVDELSDDMTDEEIKQILMERRKTGKRQPKKRIEPEERT